MFVTSIAIYIICMDKQHRSPPDMLSKSQVLTCCLNQWIGFKGKQTLTGTPGKKKDAIGSAMVSGEDSHNKTSPSSRVPDPKLEFSTHFLIPINPKFFATGLFTNLSCACKKPPCYQQLDGHLVTLYLRE